MGKSKSRGARKPTAQVGNAKPAAKVKLIQDFSEEFQQLSRCSKTQHTTNDATTKENQLLRLCSVLDQAWTCGKHDQCQSTCASIRTFIASNIPKKIGNGLAALLSSVCPLLTSPVPATRQAASIVIRTLAAKVCPELLMQHVQCLKTHVCSAVASCDAASTDTLDLLQQLLVSSPRLMLLCTPHLLPPFLAFLMPQKEPQRSMMKKLRALCAENSTLKSVSEKEKQKCRAWLEDLKAMWSEGSSARGAALTATLRRNSSLLMLLSGLVRLGAPCGVGDQRVSSQHAGALWLQAVTVVICGGEMEDQYVRSSGGDAGLQLLSAHLALLEALRWAMPPHALQKWLAALEAPLLRLHRLLLPPPRASHRPAVTRERLLWLRLSLLRLCCVCRLYRPATLHLLTRALCDLLAQLGTTLDVSEEAAALYQILFINTFTWLQDDNFQHSGHFTDKFDLRDMRAQLRGAVGGGAEALTASEAARADQLLADALEDVRARQSSAWSSRILPEAQLLRKLPRHDVKTLMSTEHQTIIDPAVADVRTTVQEEKDSRASGLETWNTMRQRLARQLFDAFLQGRVLGCCRLVNPLLALLFTCLPDTNIMPGLVWWSSLLDEVDSAELGPAAARLHRPRWSLDAAEVFEDDEDAHDENKNKKLKTC